ncbi:MAG TPA: PSD1 and planctomycete cytochrome C domain-containing protein [Bryobacteraceae bacterium]|nr:PSD1 and planctomycete cytochrome C domain-containing protein [Bryobacteraceae bacterium]
MRGLPVLLLVASIAYGATDFNRDIRPILQARCMGCHGERTQMKGLRLDNREAALRVLSPGNSSASLLVSLVSGKEPKRSMPPGGPALSAAEIAKLREWIDSGAEWPQAGALTAPKVEEHWSFRPVQRPTPPASRNRIWPRNEIDQFIVARLDSVGWDPSPEAPRTTLIRRLALDITGLPPSPQEVAEFLGDNRPDAYERLVDRLLESPHFGERWARPWLDLARYADSDGYEKDYVRPHAWRWRHWVIEAINQDMPFDQFTIEQVAGDLLPNATIDQRIATGFHRNTLTNREGGVNVEQFRVEQVMDRASTTGTAWLGLTFGCAQCHDHKYDPISQKDFYQLFAFFNGAGELDIDAPLDGEMGPYLASLANYRKEREALLAQFKVGQHQPSWEARMKEARAFPGKWTDWDHALDALTKYLDNAMAILDTDPAKRSRKQTDAMTDHFLKNYHRVISKELWKELRFTEARKKLGELRQGFPALSEAPVIVEEAVRPSHILIRGEWKQPGAAVEPAVPGFLHAPPANADRSRLTLARWLVSPRNPLTARVAVNRIWQELFGRGLVRTSENFGRQGESPTHPELLDWLSARFMDSGWKRKALIKTIVTSAVYRQSSAARPEIEATDPGNTLLFRQSRLRLSAELIRDSALQVSELLYPAIGGKSVRPPLPKGVIELAYGTDAGWPESTGRDRYRRGLYIHFQRTVPFPQLMNFDAPDATVAACKRERSNTPLQALNLLNDPTFVEAAQAVAARVLRERSKGSAHERVDYLFQVSLGRRPNRTELETSAQYVRTQISAFEKDQASAVQLFPTALVGVSRAESAAWTALASALLNLDEFLTRE